MSKPGDKYLRTISGKKEITLPDGRKEVMRVEVQVDIYDVINAWNLTDPALQHALKKLIQPGERGHKTPAQDLKEAIYSIERCLENTRPESVLLNEQLSIPKAAPLNGSLSAIGLTATDVRWKYGDVDIVPGLFVKFSDTDRLNQVAFADRCTALGLDADSAFSVMLVLAYSESCDIILSEMPGVNFPHTWFKPVTPVKPDLPAPKGMPDTTIATKLPDAPTGPAPYPPAKLGLLVAPFYHGAAEPLLYGKVLNNRSQVQRIKFHQNDTIWRNFCKKHNVPTDVFFTVADVHAESGQIFLDVEKGYAWDAIKFNVI